MAPGCLAYHEWCQAGANDHAAHAAAIAAVQTVLPLPRQEASTEAVNAVAYATRYHPEWFWRSVQHTRKWRANVRENLIGKFLATDPHCRTTFLLAAPIAEPGKHSTSRSGRTRIRVHAPNCTAS